MTSKNTRCESSACYDVEQHGNFIRITGAFRDNIGYAEDTVEAWEKFRDDIKAGLWDHIGGEQS